MIKNTITTNIELFNTLSTYFTDDVITVKIWKFSETVKVLSRNRLLTTNQTVEAKQILKELDVDFDQLLNINQNNSVCHAAGKVPFGNNLNFTTTVPPKRNTNGSKSNGSTAAISFLSFCFTFVAFYLVSL